MTRYLTADGNWRSTEQLSKTVDSSPSSEDLVQKGLLHPDNLDNLASDDLLVNGIRPTTLIRLTDGPGGVPRWVSYYDVMMSNPWAAGTINTIARGFGRLPLKLYLPDNDPDTDPGTVQKTINPNLGGNVGEQIAWALRYPNLKPNPGQKRPPNSPPSHKAMMFASITSKLIYGNTVWGVRRDKQQNVIGFRFYPTDSIEMDEENLLYKVHTPRYRNMQWNFVPERKPEEVLQPEDVCHFGLWENGIRPWNGSPVRALHMTIALFDAVYTHITTWFNNGGRLSGHLSVDGKLSDKAREAINAEIRNLYAGSHNTGKIMVSSGQWTPFHREPEFSGIIDLMKFSRDEIFVTYGVPPPVMGVLERAIMANAREMRDQYVRDLIGPHAEFFAGDFESQVIDREPELVESNVFAAFDIDEQLRPDLWKRAAVFRNLMLAYTPNELRQIEHQPRLLDEQADTIWRPLNEGPLGAMPDYPHKEDLDERRVRIEEERLQKELSQPAPAPSSPASPPEGNNDDE